MIPKSPRANLVLGGLFLVMVAIFIRVEMLNQRSSLWFDELLTYNRANQNFSDVLRDSLDPHSHLRDPRYNIQGINFFPLPIHYLLTSVGIHISPSDKGARGPALVCGILTGLVIYICGLIISDFFVGLLSGGILATALFTVYYSTECRYYSYVMFFSSLQILALLGLNQSPNKRALIYFFLGATLLNIFTHPFALFSSFIYLFPVLKYAFGHSDNKHRASIFPGLSPYIQILITIFIFLVGYYFLHHFTRRIQFGFNMWKMTPFHLKTIFEDYGNGSLVNFLILFLMMSGLWKLKDQPNVCLILLGPIIILLFSFHFFQTIGAFYPRYLSVVVPHIILISGLGLVKFSGSIRINKVKMLFVFLMLGLIFKTTYARVKNPSRIPNNSDWRGVADYIYENGSRKDLVFSADPVLGHYSKNIMGPYTGLNLEKVHEGALWFADSPPLYSTPGLLTFPIVHEKTFLGVNLYSTRNFKPRYVFGFENENASEIKSREGIYLDKYNACIYPENFDKNGVALLALPCRGKDTDILEVKGYLQFQKNVIEIWVGSSVDSLFLAKTIEGWGSKSEPLQSGPRDFVERINLRNVKFSKPEVFVKFILRVEKGSKQKYDSRVHSVSILNHQINFGKTTLVLKNKYIEDFQTTRYIQDSWDVKNLDLDTQYHVIIPRTKEKLASISYRFRVPKDKRQARIFISGRKSVEGDITAEIYDGVNGKFILPAKVEKKYKPRLGNNSNSIHWLIVSEVPSSGMILLKVNLLEGAQSFTHFDTHIRRISISGI